MAFATNSSAFGIKPAGTSIFGAPQQTNQTTNPLFGSSNAQQQQSQPAGTSMFGQPQQQPQQQQQQPGTSIFGQSQSTNTQAQNQQPAGSNLFGQPAQNQQQQGTSIFGQPAQNQQQGTSLFGQPAQQQQQGTNMFGQQQQQPGTSLFGQQQQQPAAGTSLFGQSTTQQQQPTSMFGQPQTQQGGGTSLFGQSTQGTQPAAGTSIFGQPAQQQQQQPQQQQGSSLFGGSSVFGNNNTANSNTGFGNSTFGGFGQKPLQQSTFGVPQQQQQQQQPSGPPPFSKTTKFNDLSDELKKTFEQIDAHIQGRIQISKDLQQRKLGEEATKGQELIRTVQKDLTQTSTTIHNDLHFTRDLKSKADQAVHDTIISTRIVDGFKNQANGAYLKDHASFPLEFFSRVTTQIRERLVWYRTTIEQIERKLSSMANQTHVSPQGLHNNNLSKPNTPSSSPLPSKTAALDAELQKIKALYTQLWRARTGSVRDPFEGAGVDAEAMGKTTDLGLSGLSVR